MDQSPLNDNLPTFNITMLGGSGVGKTIFMACMYVSMSARGDLSIEATPDLDTRLRGIYKQIQAGTLPGGTVGIETEYDFFLLIDLQRVAKISWIDYRGGAIESLSDNDDDASVLHERIADSDAILVMLDLSSEDLKAYPVGGTLASEHLKIGRIRNLVNHQNTKQRIKSVVFVRTKSDLVVRDDGTTDLNKACDELVAQLKDNLHFRDVAISAAIAVSSCKVLTAVVGNEEQKIVEPSDPLNTEWVLFITLKDLLAQLANLSHLKS